MKEIRCSLWSSEKSRPGCDGSGLVMSAGKDVTMGVPWQAKEKHLPNASGERGLLEEVPP